MEGEFAWRISSRKFSLAENKLITAYAITAADLSGNAV
jgi:hypothetical protein